MKRARKILKILGLTGAGLLGLTVVGLLVAWGAANTEAGRAWITAQVEAALSDGDARDGDARAVMSGLQGPFPQRLAFAELRLEDAEGAWLTLTDAQVIWRPLALLRGRVEVAAIEAETITLARLPEGEDAAAPPEAESGPLTLPHLPVPVRLERLAVETLTLGAPVLGQAARFQIQGRAAAPAGGTLDTAISVVRRDAPGGALTLDAAYSPDTRRLNLDIALNGEPGGLLDDVLPLPPDSRVRVRLNGSGPLDDWHGRLTSELGPEAGFDLKLAMAGLDSFEIAGTADLAALAPAPVPALLGGPVTLDLRLRQDAANGGGLAAGDLGGLRLAPSSVATPTARVDLEGGLDADGEAVDATAEVTVKNPAPVNALTAPAAEIADLRVKARAHGPLTAPRLDLDATLGRVATPEAILHDVTLSAGFRPAETLTQGRITADLAAARLTPGLSALDGYADTPVSLRLAGDLDLDAGRLDGGTLDLALAETRIGLESLGADLETGAAAGGLTLDIPRLARLDPVLGLGLTGAGRLAGPLTVTPSGNDMVRAELQGGFDNAAWGTQPVLDALAGGRLDLATRLRVGADGALDLKDLTLRGPALAVRGSVALPGDFSRLNGDLRADLPDLAPLGAALDLPLAGGAGIDLALSGPTGNPALNATVEASDLNVAGTDLGATTITARLADLAEGLNGPLQIRTATSPAGPAEIDTTLALGGDALRVTATEARVPGARVEASALTVPLDGGAIVGAATLDLAGFDALHPNLGVPPLEGWGVVRADLRAGPEGGQRLRLDGQIHDLAAEGGGRADRLDLTATLDNAFAAPAGEARATLSKARVGETKLETATLDLDGGLDAADLRLRAEGALFGPVTLDTRARVERDGARTTLTLKTLDARVQDRNFTLPQAATFALGPDLLAVSDLVLASGGGTLSLDVRQGGGTVDIAADLADLPVGLANLALAQPKLQGRLNGRLTLNGPAAAPSGNLTLNGADLAVAGADMPPVALAINADLAPGEVGVTANVTGLSETPVTFEGRVPATLALDPAGLALDRTAPLNARLDWQGDLAPLMPLVPVAGHRVGGTGQVALRLGGTLAAPVPEGTVTITDGVYENLETGTLLTDIAMRLESDGQRVNIANFTARDGGKGRVTLSGGIDLGAGANAEPRVDLGIQARQAVLVRLDEGSAQTRVDLDIQGALTDLAVAGRIVVEQAAFQIPRGLPADVAELDVVEVGRGNTAAGAAADSDESGEEDAAADSETAPPARIALDIQVEIPNQAFLRGQGLESEWAGQIDIAGTADQPIVTGGLQAVRGRIDALGNAFTLQSGSVSFDGGDDIDPEIDTEAVHEGENITVTARVSGPASNPQFELTSQPELPRDEILSRMLFGEDTGQLSPAQAAQLAAAAAELSGVTGGGPGTLGRVRGALGLDVLRLGGDTATSVTAGRYITDDVFVGVEQGLESESSKVTVELGLTDNIAVESNVGATGQSNVGIQFKWDY